MGGQSGSLLSKFKPRCEQCFNLKSSEELKTVMKTCWESSDKNSYMMKIKNCIFGKEDSARNERMKALANKMMSMYLEKAWLKLFVPSTSKRSIFMTEDTINEKRKCLIEKLGLGSVDNLDRKGYTEMITTHLIGDDKEKEALTMTVEQCGAEFGEGKMSFSMFTKCALPMLETSCGIEK